MSGFILRKTPAAEPIRFDPAKCTNCGSCLEACMIDVLLPGDKHPVAAYPDECWYCGCCVMECPAGAVSLHHPLMNQTRWVAKESLLKKHEKHKEGE